MSETNPKRGEGNDPATEQFAESLKAAAAALGNTSDLRVEAMRRKLLSGEYHPSAKDIAAKIIDEHLS